jgi:hypothetical protein
MGSFAYGEAGFLGVGVVRPEGLEPPTFGFEARSDRAGSGTRGSSPGGGLCGRRLGDPPFGDAGNERGGNQGGGMARSTA